MTHIKLYRRGEGCEVPDGAEYLMVTAHDVDDSGEWIPTDVQAVQTWVQLKEQLQKSIAGAGTDGIVVKASAWFDRVASGLGLRQLKSEWGRL